MNICKDKDANTHTHMHTYTHTRTQTPTRSSFQPIHKENAQKLSCHIHVAHFLSTPINKPTDHEPKIHLRSTLSPARPPPATQKGGAAGRRESNSGGVAACRDCKTGLNQWETANGSVQAQ